MYPRSTRKQAIAVFSLLLALAAATSPLHASEEKKGPDDTPAGSHAAPDHESTATPNILSGDLGNVFWTSAIFVVLLIVLRATAWKPILTALQNRERFIVDSLSAAKHDREESHRLLTEYQAKVEKAREEATDIVEEGRRDAEETRKRILAEAKTDAEAIVARAKRDIELARDDAIKRLHQQGVQLGTTIAAKLIHRELTSSDHQALLNDSLTDLGKLN